MQLDLKPEELFVYEGSSPRPDDFDEYWARALAEMNAVEANVEFVPASFSSPGAECFDVWFTGVRGARIHALYLRPAGRREPGPAVVQFHGYSGSAGGWADKLAYVSAGLCVAALDCRGQGGLSEDRGGTPGSTFHGQIIRGLDSPTPDDLLFRHIYLDCAQLVHIIMDLPEVDPARVGVTGGSQGGGLTIAAAGLVPEVKIAVSHVPFLTDYRRVWYMDMDERAYEELRSYFRYHDPMHEREDEIFSRLGYIDVQNLAPRIRADFTMYTGLLDNVCPPSTQFAAFNKIPGSNKRAVLMPDFGHEIPWQASDRTFQKMLEL